MSMQDAVKARYSEGARQRQETLCCPVDYAADLLEALPEEVIAKDYGCGDPSRYVREGDTVLDLGSGSGKICYMAAQLVGSRGRVIGVDMNDEMLALARKYLPDMRARLGGVAIEFVKAKIEDLALDVGALETYLAAHPVRAVDDLEALNGWCARQRRERPLIADAAIDLVTSNCVLNLVDDDRKQRLMREIARVLKPGGRIAVSDIVSDRPVPETLKSNADLWSGCLAGAFQEQAFVEAFEQAGLAGVRLDKCSAAPWRTVQGIEFRAVTVTGFKPDSRPGDGHRVLIYTGPYRSIEDLDGKRYRRGERAAVGGATAARLLNSAYGGDFAVIDDAALQPSGAAAQDNAPCCG